MLDLDDIHHIAVLCSDYSRSKAFYCEIMGLTLLSEHYRPKQDSWKADLALNGRYVLELFSYPDPPRRISWPEACGLRHLAFSVTELDQSVAKLKQAGIVCEEVRTDPYTQRRFTFFSDPDGLPLELYEQVAVS